MSSYTLPPLDLSDPLSKRAVQILRELQGLKLLDKNDTGMRNGYQAGQANAQAASHGAGRVDPVMGKGNAKATAPKKGEVVKTKSTKKATFSRDNYLKDVRSNLVGSMIFSIVMLCLALGLIVTGTRSYLLPSLENLQQQSETIKRLPSDLKSVTDQIESQTTQQKDIAAQLESLVRFFPNPQQTYNSYSNFLTLLEGQKVAVTLQKGGVSQSPANPLLSEQGNDLKDANKPKDPKQPAAPAPKLTMLSGDMKAGLNYYHLLFKVEGSYVGYLSARQALVNENPNLVVHSETVLSNKDKPSTLEITAVVSIPFIYKP